MADKDVFTQVVNKGGDFGRQFGAMGRVEDGAVTAMDKVGDAAAASVQFGNAEEALVWATEVLRVRRFPKITGIYSGNVRPEVVAHGGSHVGEDAYTLALSIYQCVHRLDTDLQEVLNLHVWGDFATPVRLRAAEAVQEGCRQQGKRVRLSYRYSQRQLATILGVSKSTALRRLEAAYGKLDEALAAIGLVG